MIEELKIPIISTGIYLMVTLFLSITIAPILHWLVIFTPVIFIISAIISSIISTVKTETTIKEKLVKLIPVLILILIYFFVYFKVLNK